MPVSLLDHSATSSAPSLLRATRSGPTRWRSHPLAVSIEAAAAQPSLSSADAQNPQPANTAFNLTAKVQNWADGMTAQVSPDQDIGDGKATDPQSVDMADDGTSTGTATGTL